MRLNKFVAVLTMAVVLGGAGLHADDPIAPPESVGFSTAGLKAFQQAMRALVDDLKSSKALRRPQMRSSR